MPRIGGQDFTAAELRAYFAANNPLRKPAESYSASYVRRVASAQLRGESAGLSVSRQAARRGGTPERPGRPARPAPSIPGFIRQVEQTVAGRFRAGAQRTGRQVGDTLREFLRAGVERVRVAGTFTPPDGEPHPFLIGRKGGYTTRYLARLIAEHGSWADAVNYLLSTVYGDDYGALDMGSIELVS